MSNKSIDKVDKVNKAIKDEVSIRELMMKDGDYLDEGYYLKREYNRLDGERQELIENCEVYAGKTIPSEFVNDDTDRYREKQVDFQSFGALMVNNLANKIASSLFPTNMPFFKAELTDEQLVEYLYGITDETGNLVQEPKFETKGDIDLALSNAEKAAIKLLYKSLPRAKIVSIMKQLIITGNCLLDMSGKKWKVHTLRNYVVERNEDREVSFIIIREKKRVSQLNESHKEVVYENNYKDDQYVNIYTGIKLKDGMYTIWQELEDLCYCHKKLGRQKLDDLDFIPLTWTLADTNSYGVGHVEMFYNNLKQLSDKAELEATLGAINANVKYLVDPAAAVDIDLLINSKSGSYIPGIPTGVIAVESGVNNILQELAMSIEVLKRELSQAFLYNINVVRDAERVTAEEIRLLANEIEAGLGGTYSQISDQLQYPIARKTLKTLENDFADIDVIVTTGLESLNKRDEASRVIEFFNGIQVLGTVPEPLMDYINFEQALKTIAANLHLPINIVNTNEQVQAIQQQRAQQEQQMMAQQAGMQEGAKAGAQMALEQQVQQ